MVPASAFEMMVADAAALVEAVTGAEGMTILSVVEAAGIAPLAPTLETGLAEATACGALLPSFVPAVQLLVMTDSSSSCAQSILFESSPFQGRVEANAPEDNKATPHQQTSRRRPFTRGGRDER